ncbi:methylthioribulose-1-phosphate dehydratase [Thioalkalivibrio paradoxus ARh 1]|uniref:Methylthioribulose-1-phosphate dehydratase n=1 Tax=Thioalkalivibrio paradoxus ARh 1 TaxID=713585 RepID=W0DL58_9GAMM|nr:methylthioribulose-1-phosphate dehydratase [Thioalkalivibrio paradoxus ARh 1]
MIEDSLEYKAQVRLLADAGRLFAQRGWVPATAGNFSARLNEEQIVITVSGRHKGHLDDSGFMVVDLEGNILSPGKTPSAETFLHIIMYRRDPSIGAVLHTHSANATVLSRLLPYGLTLSDYVVLKAFPAITSDETSLHVPVFPNTHDVPQLAAQVDDHMNRHPGVSGYLVSGHGLYTWGRSVEAAVQHVEAFEFLFECEILSRRLSP